MCTSQAYCSTYTVVRLHTQPGVKAIAALQARARRDVSKSNKVVSWVTRVGHRGYCSGSHTGGWHNLACIMQSSLVAVCRLVWWPPIRAR
jgi:hypothetical protein